jgi:hypothetical protein
MDLELLRGADLPLQRAAFVHLCCSLGVAPESVGFLPYAIAEWTERLAVCFAEHRAWPANESVRGKCLLSAGILAHYVQDLCQPLHLTIHFDGRAGPDGKSPRSGIHAKVDGLIENLEFSPSMLARGQEGTPPDSLMPFIMAELLSSHALVDTVYGMAKLLPDSAGAKVSGRVVSFATQRARRAVGLTADFFATAWRLSGAIEFEKWLDRDAMDAASRKALAAPRKGRGK